MPQNTFDEKSSLVQVLAWHHLRQQAIAWANVNTLRQNGYHFRDIIFKCIVLNEYMFILMKISLIFVPKGPINNILALVQIMAWCRPGDKPLSESLMVSLLIHICITQPQWVNPDLCWPMTPLGHSDSILTLKRLGHFKKKCNFIS